MEKAGLARPFLFVGPLSGSIPYLIGMVLLLIFKGNPPISYGSSRLCSRPFMTTHPVSPYPVPEVRRVSKQSPWFWLAAGWRDFVHAPGVSLMTGLVITFAMLLVVSLVRPSSYPFLAAVVFAVTVFLGPLLAVGLYELSRRMEHRKSANLLQLHVGWLRNISGVLGAGAVLLLLMLGWYLISMMLGTALFGMDATSEAASGMLSVGMLFVFSAVGVVTMAVTFVLMVVSVPMLIDRSEIDIVTAMHSSLRAVQNNPGVIVLWATLIVLFTALAVAPLFLGLSVVFPLLAYASWHAYRDLIVH
jgi:uncharacterized membrane protein